MADKLQLVKYFVEIEVKVSLKNRDLLLPIDMAQGKGIQYFLKKLQKPQDMKKLAKQKTRTSTKSPMKGKAKPASGPALQFENKMSLHIQERGKQLQEAPSKGLVQRNIEDADDVAPSARL